MTKMEAGSLMNAKFRITIFPVLFLLFLLLITIQNRALIFENKNSVIYTYTQSFLTGKIGSGYGIPQVSYIPFSSLEPGDILLGGWPNCAYGKYSHAGLYLGNDEVLEAYVDYGVCIQPLEHFNEYTELCFLRVEVSPEIKNKALRSARSFVGKTFYPVAFKQNDRYFNCSNIIWKAYAEQGINLDIHNDIWVAPESFRDSSYVSKIYEKGM